MTCWCCLLYDVSRPACAHATEQVKVEVAHYDNHLGQVKEEMTHYDNHMGQDKVEMANYNNHMGQGKSR